ncbi:ribonuclease H-like domain-containing protein, partial [Tanacetum coccineum]
RFKVTDGYVNNKGKEILEESLLLMVMRPLGFISPRNKENTRRVVPVETTTSNTLVYYDGSGYDWSDLAEEGLESVEARLLVYKKNESVYEEDIKVLKCEIHLREVVITELRRKLELAQKQKDEIQLTVENFDNSSKNLSKLINCQIVDKCKTGLGYNAFPPPYTGNFMPPKLDLSFSGLEEFLNEPIVSEPTVKKPVVKNSEAKASGAKPKAVRKNNGAPIIDDWVSDNEEDDVPQAKIEKKTFKPSFVKIDFVKAKQTNKTDRKTTKQYDYDNNQRQFNNKKMVKPVWNYTQRVNHQNFSRMTHPNPKRNMVPKSVLMRAITTLDLQDKGVIDGCSRHMTGNMSISLQSMKLLRDGYVAFRGNPKGGKSQEKLIDESQVLLRVPRKNYMYSVDLKNIVPKGGLTCLFAKATSDESKLWHRRLGHLNFKTMNKLVKGNLVRGLPSKLFENDQTCVACQKGE